MKLQSRLPSHRDTHHLSTSDSPGYLLCTHPHPGEREGWGISLYGLGNDSLASCQWSWSLKHARDRLGHKLRAGILYHLLEGHTVHKLRVEEVWKGDDILWSPSPYLLHCLSLVYIIVQHQRSRLLGRHTPQR